MGALLDEERLPVATESWIGDAGYNGGCHNPDNRLRRLPDRGRVLRLAATAPECGGLHHLPKSRANQRGHCHSGGVLVRHLGAAQSGRNRRQLRRGRAGGVRPRHGRHPRDVHVRRPPHPAVNAQRPLHHRIREASFRHGPLCRHLRGHTLCDWHIHHRRDDRHHRGRQHPHQPATLDHRRSRRRGGGDLHCLRGTAYVHLYRPHPVPCAHAGGAVACHRGSGHGRRGSRHLAQCRRGRSDVPLGFQWVFLRHRSHHRHRGVQRLPPRDVAAGVHHRESEVAQPHPVDRRCHRDSPHLHHGIGRRSRGGQWLSGPFEYRCKKVDFSNTG